MNYDSSKSAEIVQSFKNINLETIFVKNIFSNFNFWITLFSKIMPNEEEEDPHPRGFWLILLPHSPGNEIFDSSHSSFLEE